MRHRIAMRAEVATILWLARMIRVFLHCIARRMPLATGCGVYVRRAAAHGCVCQEKNACDKEEGHGTGRFAMRGHVHFVRPHSCDVTARSE